MYNYRVLIADDNEDSLNILKYQIQKTADFTVVDTCRNGEELIDSTVKYLPDVIVLDINMPVVNGMDAIQECLKIKRDLLFIFVTSYDEYAVQAFELSAVDYIVKPIGKARLYAALDKVRRLSSTHLLQTKNKLIIKEGSDYNFIPASDILFIEKIGKKSHIHTTSSTFVTSINISDLIKELPAGSFFMSHRSYIVNLSKIARVVSRNQTFLIYFENSNKFAHVSRLKIEEFQKKIMT